MCVSLPELQNTTNAHGCEYSISTETGVFILAFVVYFSMPETNHSATACGRWRLTTEYIQDLNLLCCRPHKHELVFKCQSAWYGADLCVADLLNEDNFLGAGENLKRFHSHTLYWLDDIPAF